MLQLSFLNLDSSTTQHTLEMVFKFFFIISGFLYLGFALIVIRQIQIMKNTLITGFSPAIKTIGLIHLGLAAVVLLYFLLGL